MYRVRAAPRAVSVDHRFVLLHVSGLLAWLVLAACGPASYVEESDSTAPPASQPDDVRERTLAALQQPGMITRVEYDIQVVVHGLVTVERNVAWLDFASDTVRLETGNPPTILLKGGRRLAPPPTTCRGESFVP